MTDLLITAGRWIGILGIVLCAVAVVLRLLGLYWVMNFGTGTLLQVGMAGVLIGCFLLLFGQTKPR